MPDLSPDPDDDPEDEPDSGEEDTAAAAGPKRQPSIPYELIGRAWNLVAEKRGWQIVRTPSAMDETRQRQIRSCYSSNGTGGMRGVFAVLEALARNEHWVDNGPGSNWATIEGAFRRSKWPPRHEAGIGYLTPARVAEWRSELGIPEGSHGL